MENGIVINGNEYELVSNGHTFGVCCKYCDIRKFCNPNYYCNICLFFPNSENKYFELKIKEK